MSKPKRHKSGSRLRRSRLPIAIGVVLAVVGLIIYGCTAIKHQMSGYFDTNKDHAATSQSPVPGEASPATQSPELMPSPSAISPETTGPKVAIIIDDCGYNEERCKVFLQLPI